MFFIPKVNKQRFELPWYSAVGVLFIKIKRHLSVPVISSILQNRLFAGVIIVVACVQTILAILGFRGWPCPFQTILKFPCPGCGLSTSLSQLLKGNWAEALHTHAFAPVILTGLIFMTVVCLLPEKYYFKAVRMIETFERASGFTPVLLAAMLLYWGIRLVYIL